MESMMTIIITIHREGEDFSMTCFTNKGMIVKPC
jgi:hypothetical protein